MGTCFAGAGEFPSALSREPQRQNKRSPEKEVRGNKGGKIGHQIGKEGMERVAPATLVCERIELRTGFGR